jgi:asparagine synthase (glutamine-hydrolysing)
MCGVAAIFAYHYAALDVVPEELHLIRDAMAKRGPDGYGEWYSDDMRVGLGHRRLSIIDLSAKGTQPMSNVDGTLVISFNGEIYNYKELREELERKGYKFRSQTDTEVLLHLYAEKGESMFDDLRGMFAFVLWDVRKKAMLLARDPFGIKPLYYADDGWMVRVASQVKALLASNKISRMKDPAGIVGFYLMGSVPEPFTCYQEIRAVPAGSFVWVDNLGPSSPRQYFSIADTFAQLMNGSTDSSGDAQEIIREAVKDSVRYHFVADVPVGIFLSSGIDSCSLVGLARDAGIKDIQTVTLAFREFEGQPYDESLIAEEVARTFHTDHYKYTVSQEEFSADLAKVLDAMDQPTIDGMNIYFVSKAVGAKGLKVALTGLGGDELFGGYPSFQRVPGYAKYMRLPSLLPGLGLLVRTMARPKIFQNLSPKAAGMVEYGGTYQGSYFLQRGLFMPWELSSIVGKEIAREGLHRLSLISRIKSALRPDPKGTFARVASLEMSFYMRNQLLRDADWAGMAHSLEIRVPFVDIRLFKAMVPILRHWNSDSHKEFLAKSSMTPLGDNVIYRSKTGFIVPIDKWIQSCKSLDEWRGVPDLARNGCHWSRRWAYTVYHHLAS